jgi:hypothetical protein
MRKIFVFCLGLLLLVGCAKKPSAPLQSGKLTYKSKPVNNATLILYPAGGKESESFTFSTSHDGTFEISHVPPGEYKVVVQGSAGVQQANLEGMDPKKRAEAEEKLRAMQTPPTIPFPDRYKDPQKTDLRLTLTEKDSTHDLVMKD